MVDTEQDAYKVAKALLELARGPAQKATASYENDRDFALGTNHWPTPRTYTQLAPDKDKAKTVRNWLFATIDQKRAVVLDATPSLHVEPLNDLVTIEQRAKIADVVRHELERLRWESLRKAIFWDAAIIGKGVAMVRTERDKFSGEHKLRLERVDPRRFYPDPSADCLAECRFVVYEPELDLSVIKDIFPDQGHRVKPSARQETNIPNWNRKRTDEEIILAPGQEIALQGEGKLSQRKASVAFVWIKDDSVSEDTEQVILKDRREIFECPQCSAQFEDGPTCPGCSFAGEPETITLPAETATNTVFTRRYPFGRLICISGEVLLYDGENPYQLDTVFPFAEFEYYNVPGRYWGFSDVALLKSAQMVADVNMAQLIDAMRYTLFGYFEYPANELAYATRGNTPGQAFPVRPENAGRARWITPQSYNAQLHSVADEINNRDFQKGGGVTDVSIGAAPTAPTSGVEVQARQRAAATRIGMQLKQLNRFDSDLASLVWKMMNQFYVGPRSFLVRTPASDFDAIVEDVSLLPRDVSVVVSADLDSAEKDRLMGQNLTMAIQSGVLINPLMRPFLPMYLTALGLPPSVVRQTIEVVDQQLAFQQAMLVSAGNGESPPPGTSKTGVPPGRLAGALAG